MHKLSDKEFQIGLTMSGAISAGAYTAGVIDFLAEALDAWEDARSGPDGDGSQPSGRNQGHVRRLGGCHHRRHRRHRPR